MSPHDNWPAYVAISILEWDYFRMFEDYKFHVTEKNTMPIVISDSPQIFLPYDIYNAANEGNEKAIDICLEICALFNNIHNVKKKLS